MVVVKVEDQSLDLNPGQGISWNRKSPMFLDGDLENIIESYTFPIDVPLTGRNKTILDCPAEIDSWQPLEDELRCDVYYHGVFLFSGTGYLTDASEESVKLTIVTNSLKDLKEMSLNILDLGSHSEDNLEDLLTHAKATATNPLDFDYCFFPVVNLAVTNLPSTQNYWDDENDTFVSDGNATMPFIRLDFVLSKLFEKIGFSLENEWQLTDELKKLYIYNNHDLIIRDNVSEINIDLRNHVPVIKLNEWLKSLATLFCLGVFPDNITKKSRLIPLFTLLEDAEVVDWTYSAEKAYVKRTPKTWPDKLGYSITGSDELAEPNKPIDIDIKGTVDQFDDLDSITEQGVYYVKSLNTYYECQPGKVSVAFKKQFNEIKLDNPEVAAFESKMSPLYMTEKIKWDYHAPEIYLESGKDPGNRIIFYRGFKEVSVIGGETSLYRPLANNNEYDYYEEIMTDLEHTLLWDGDLGIYKTYWEPWVNFLKNRKIIKRKLFLNIKDLLNFTFDKKVRIGNMNYFVNSLQVNLSTSRSKVVEVDAELSSVIY